MRDDVSVLSAPLQLPDIHEAGPEEQCAQLPLRQQAQAGRDARGRRHLVESAADGCELRGARGEEGEGRGGAHGGAFVGVGEDGGVVGAEERPHLCRGPGSGGERHNPPFRNVI